MKSAKFTWNISPFPKGPAKHVTLATTDAYAIWKGTKYPDAAWELLEFVTSRYFGKVLAKVFLLQPARKSVVLDWYGILRDNYPVLRDVDLEVFGDAILEKIPVVQEIFRKPGESRELGQPAMDRIFRVGDATPDLFKEVCEEITKVNREK